MGVRDIKNSLNTPFSSTFTGRAFTPWLSYRYAPTKSVCPDRRRVGSKEMLNVSGSTCSPTFGERDVFDPQRLIRMANLGMDKQLLTSPSLWLCLGCQRCTDSCSQLVRGHDIIREYQDRAIAEGYVDPFFHTRLMEADRLIYPRFLDEIDVLLGLYTPSG